MMFRSGLKAFVVRAAPVANNGVANPEIKGPIENRRTNEDGVRKPFLVPAIGEYRQRERGREDEEAKAVREVLLLVKLVIAAHGTGSQRRIAGVKMLAMIATGTLPIAR